MDRPHKEISICMQLHQTPSHRILTIFPTFWQTPETLNRRYTTKRLQRKRNLQRLHQQMEGTSQRISQNGIKARKEKRHTAQRNSSSRFSLGLQPGDRVLVRNMFQREGTGKIRDFWKEKFMLLFQEYVITGQHIKSSKKMKAIVNLDCYKEICL